MFAVYAEPGCYNPDWEVSRYQYSLGATQYGAAQSVQECLDYCGGQAGCVAVSVDMTEQPPACWPHLSDDDLLPLNVRRHRGFNQYRLRERCATGPVTGSLLLVTFIVICSVAFELLFTILTIYVVRIFNIAEYYFLW